jgi:Fibronectin type III domain
VAVPRADIGVVGALAARLSMPVNLGLRMKFWSRAVMAAAAAVGMSAVAADAVSAPTPAGTPSRPSSPTATAGDTQVKLTWVAPTVGKNIMNYTVKINPGGRSQQIIPPVTNALVTSLTNGTLYTFTVTATNAIGTGPPSLAVTATPHAVPPGRPTNLGAVQDPDGVHTNLSWTPPTSNGSMPDGSTASITSYNITVSPGGISQQVPATTTTYVASTPANNITYTFSVSATNTRPLTGAVATVYAPIPSSASIGLQPTAGGATTSITVSGQFFLNNESITLYWDDPSHVAAAAVTDASGGFSKVVKPFAGDKPKVHKLCATVQPKPCANFTLQPPPSPTPKVSPSPSPVESPSPSSSPSDTPQASGARPGGGLSGFDIITRPPFVFLPIIGILGLIGVIAYWALSSRRRPQAPTSATVVHLATRPDYMSPFPAPVTPPVAAPQPPVVPPLQSPAQPPLPAAGPPPIEPPQTMPRPPPAPTEPPPTIWPAISDEPPDLPEPGD